MIEAKLSTEQVLLSHLQAEGTGNMEALMQNYTEESVFITPAGVFSGLAKIREEFERLLAPYPPGSRFTLIQQSVAGDYSYLIWSGESAYITIPFATDTFLIRDGKILLQTFAAQIIPKNG